MRQRRKITVSELILLILPVLALLGLGIGLRFRTPAVVAAPKPFKLVIDGVKVTPVPDGSLSHERNRQRLEVVVSIGHQGKTPAWWGSPINSISATNWPRVHFTGKGEKDDGVSNIGGFEPAKFDESIGQYTFLYTGSVPQDPKYLKGATCHVSVAFESLGSPVKILGAAKATFSGQQLE